MKTAIVSGGTSGIGAAICERFVREGWRVISLSRRPPTVSGVEHLPVDLSTQAAAAIDFKVVLAEPNEPVTLIHNAGEFCHDSADAVDQAYLARGFQLMVAGPALLNHLLVPWLIPGSSILYLGSTLSEIAVPRAFSYSTLKHAVVGQMRATQQDFSGRSVHSCCICPGVSATPMVLENTAIDDAFLSERVSFARLVDPAEIASLAFFCATSPSLNGSVVHANLGQINR